MRNVALAFGTLPGMAGRNQVIAWADLTQQSLLCDALEAANMQLAAIGSDDLGAATKLSESFGVERESDLRQAVHRPGTSMMWFFSPRRISEDECGALRERPIKTLCLHAPISSLADGSTEAFGTSCAKLAPLLLSGQAFRAAADVLEQFGERRCVQVFAGCRTNEGSTLVRLFDAMEVLHTLLGDADSVTASLTPPATGALDSLDQLQGTLSAHVRCAGGAAATLTASNDAAAWRRSAMLLGEGGSVMIDDAGFTWIDRDGRTAAEHRVPPPHGPGALFGQCATRWLAQLDAADAPSDLIAVLAMCEAARLSCLTAQAEDPARVLEMMGKP